MQTELKRKIEVNSERFITEYFQDLTVCMHFTVRKCKVSYFDEGSQSILCPCIKVFKNAYNTRIGDVVCIELFLFLFLFFFSGMPHCKLGLNDRVLMEAQGRSTKGKLIDLDGIKFHQYVDKFLTIHILLLDLVFVLNHLQSLSLGLEISDSDILDLIQLKGIQILLGGYYFFKKIKVVNNYNFGRCVRLASFENHRTISFTPLDGSFELMTYMFNTQVF